MSHATSFLRVVAAAAPHAESCTGKCNVYRCKCLAMQAGGSSGVCRGCAHGQMYHSIPLPLEVNSVVEAPAQEVDLSEVDNLEKRAMMKLARARRMQSAAGLHEAFVMLVRGLEVLSERRDAAERSGGSSDALLQRMQVMMQHCDAVKAAMDALSGQGVEEVLLECTNCGELFSGNFCQCCGHQRMKRTVPLE